MKKKLSTIVTFVCMVMVVSMLAGCTSNKPDQEESKSLETYVKGIKDITIEKDEKVDYMKGITYDKEVVKTVTADCSKVDATKVGKYDIVYTIKPKNTDKFKDVTIKAKVTVKEKSLTSYVKGLKDWTVEINAKNVDFMKDVTFDKKVIKEVTVDKSKVDLTKEGKYKLTYTIVPIDNSISKESVTKTVTVNVVSEKEAQEEANSSNNTDDTSSDNTVAEKPSAPSQPTEPTKPAEPETPAHQHSYQAVNSYTVTDSEAVYGTRWVETSPAYDEPSGYHQWSNGHKTYSAEESDDYNAYLISIGEMYSCHYVDTTIHHDAQGYEETYEISPAKTHTVTEYKCSCGDSYTK